MVSHDCFSGQLALLDQHFNFSGEEAIVSQTDLDLKSRVMEPGMGVHRTGDLRNGALLDISANCTVRLVGTNTVLSNVPGSILTNWNVSMVVTREGIFCVCLEAIPFIITRPNQ